MQSQKKIAICIQEIGHGSSRLSFYIAGTKKILGQSCRKAITDLAGRYMAQNSTSAIFLFFFSSGRGFLHGSFLIFYLFGFQEIKMGQPSQFVSRHLLWLLGNITFKLLTFFFVKQFFFPKHMILKRN